MRQTTKIYLESSRNPLGDHLKKHFTQLEEKCHLLTYEKPPTIPRQLLCPHSWSPLLRRSANVHSFGDSMSPQGSIQTSTHNKCALLVGGFWQKIVASPSLLTIGTFDKHYTRDGTFIYAFHRCRSREMLMFDYDFPTKLPLSWESTSVTLVEKRELTHPIWIDHKCFITELPNLFRA